MTQTESLPANARLVAYLATFVEECRERLVEMSEELAGEEIRDASLDATERAVHQIAGSAAMTGCGGVALFARLAERFVRLMRRGAVRYGTSQRVLLLRVAAALSAALDRVAGGDMATRPEPELSALLEAWTAGATTEE